jgi:hypothetical protein
MLLPLKRHPWRLAALAALLGLAGVPTSARAVMSPFAVPTAVPTKLLADTSPPLVVKAPSNVPLLPSNTITFSQSFPSSLPPGSSTSSSGGPPVNNVPEPGALLSALFGTSLAGLAAWRRKRRKGLAS